MATAMAMPMTITRARARSSGYHHDTSSVELSPKSDRRPPIAATATRFRAERRTTRTYPTTADWQRNFLDSIERRDYSYAYKAMKFEAPIPFARFPNRIRTPPTERRPVPRLVLRNRSPREREGPQVIQWRP